MQIGQAGIDLIKQHEGCRLTAYRCPAGVWTIGYGHTGSDVKEGLTITPVKAEKLLKSDLAKFEKHVQNFDSKYHWNQNEFDALVSFAFNVGSINQLTANKTRTKAQIAQAMLLYNKANGKVLPGLTKRRQAERQLFLTPVQEVKSKVDVTQSKVKKLPIIVNGRRYEVDGVFEAGVNYFSVRQLAQLLDATVSNQGSVPVLTKK